MLEDILPDDASPFPGLPERRHAFVKQEQERDAAGVRVLKADPDLPTRKGRAAFIHDRHAQPEEVSVEEELGRRRKAHCLHRAKAGSREAIDGAVSGDTTAAQDKNTRAKNDEVSMPLDHSASSVLSCAAFLDRTDSLKVAADERKDDRASGRDSRSALAGAVRNTRSRQSSPTDSIGRGVTNTAGPELRLMQGKQRRSVEALGAQELLRPTTGSACSAPERPPQTPGVDEGALYARRRHVNPDAGRSQLWLDEDDAARNSPLHHLRVRRQLAPPSASAAAQGDIKQSGKLPANYWVGARFARTNATVI
ncbi:unnamed protein product [Amoebophrya sp. A120]|nr:unnamed protein product [Amoebophrya sp. A120]|eukprot:GSA120T00017521001.1